MSSTADIKLGDPSHGGALFLLPREIRDEIYRLLVKGRYLAHKPLNKCGRCNEEDSDSEWSDCESEVIENDEPDFSILQVSKTLSDEAKETLYADSTFRFIISTNCSRNNDNEHGTLLCLKEVAPMMKNVTLDIDGKSIDWAEWFHTRGCTKNAKALEQNLRSTIGLFGDSDIKRHSLHIRFLNSSTTLALWSTPCSDFFLDPPKTLPLRKTSFSGICQSLKVLSGFHVATIEIMLTRNLIDDEPFFNYGISDGEPKGRTRDLVRRITHVVQKQLEPAFGSAISSFKSDTRNMPVPKGNLLKLGDTSLVGFIGFRPSAPPIKNPSANTV